MQEIVKTRTFAEFAQEVMENVKRTAFDAKALAEDFIIMGYLLAEAEETDILKGSDCKSMGEFAKKYYGIDKSTASRFININKRYSVGGNSRQLDPKYSNFGYTKLAEMLTLPETITEEISPELTRSEIRAIKAEVDEEKKISDIEVMLEEKDEGVEAEDTLLGKLIYQIGHEHQDIFERLWKAVNVDCAETKVLNSALAPTGIATISCRIPGTGRYMLSINEDEKIKTMFLRDNSKEEFTWEELQQVAVALLKTDAPNWKETYRNIYNEEIPEEKPEVAPAQPKSERVVKHVKPEKSKKNTKKDLPVTDTVPMPLGVPDYPEDQLPGQMKVADYPEMMPENQKVIESTTKEAQEVAANDGEVRGIAGRNVESISGSGEQGETDSERFGATSDESETTQSNGESSEKEKYERVRQAARDRLDAVHAVFWGWENEKTIPKEELEMALKNAKNLVNAIETLILMTGEQ